MKLYKITPKNNIEKLIYADKVEVLNSGQIVLLKNDEVISIFSINTDVVCAEEDRKDYQAKWKEELDVMLNDIIAIDEFFMTDVFLRKNTTEEASDKLRRIAGLVMKTIFKINAYEI